MSKSVDQAHEVPGVYVLFTHRSMLFIEIDEQRQCHQLKPDTLERDGILDRDKWNRKIPITAYGPLVRPATQLNASQLGDLAAYYGHAESFVNNELSAVTLRLSDLVAFVERITGQKVPK